MQFSSSFIALRLETPLDNALLGGLDEAEIGQLEFRLVARDADDITLSHRIEMLARDEWGPGRDG